MAFLRRRSGWWLARGALHVVGVGLGAGGLTLVFFLVLPLMQTINKPPKADVSLVSVDGALEPPPPLPPEEEEEKPPEETKEAPKLAEESRPLDLGQIELVLNPGTGGEGVGPDVGLSLKNIIKAADEGGPAIFSIGDLDQKPRPTYQPGPMVNSQMRSRTPGTVYIIFVVDPRGRVENPVVQKSSDPVFEGPALAAVKQWRFDPGKRNGQAVRFRMRVPITFPKGR